MYSILKSNKLRLLIYTKVRLTYIIEHKYHKQQEPFQ